jgi:SAM-dependent methyltransferase
MAFNADEALEWFLKDLDPKSTVLDIGCGGNIKPMFHTPRLRTAGHTVDAMDTNSRHANIHGRFEDTPMEMEKYDGVWASHVLEHAENVGEFLRKSRLVLKHGGIFSVTVPPASHHGHILVPGHISLWTPALLCYNLIIAGWDLSAARLGTYDKNISIVTPRMDAVLPNLKSCRGDIEALAKFFPTAVSHGGPADLPNTRW